MLLVTLKAGFSVRWFDMFLSHQAQLFSFTVGFVKHQGRAEIELPKFIMKQSSRLEIWIECP